jgi:nucleoside-diphosphate-sugar epimerase
VSSHTLFVTGATGAIGPPLLRALADRADVDQLYALTHVTALAGDHAARVIVVRGDVSSADGLRLASADASLLTGTVTGIVHLAADTRFTAPLDELRRTNVEGLANVLAFSRTCPRLERLLVLSTTHVAGRRTGLILENELEHGDGFVNAYEQSKYEGELALRSAGSGLPVAVCRLSTVIGDSVSGEIARRGAIHHGVLALYAGLAPMVPGTEDSPVDLLALDEAVSAIAILATDAFRPGAIWHLCGGEFTLTAGELVDLAIEAIQQYRPSWRRKAIERPAFVNLETFDLFRRSVEQVGDPAMRAATAIVAQFAPQLAFPKRFDDRHCRASLHAAGLQRLPARDVWTRVVKRLVQTRASAPRDRSLPSHALTANEDV